mmetsp:Transcript_1918/g.4585  ORF Transcript_1918/g.4585 Transcript_1918/m.4585 type:complete len:190 (-) Transcript_1918:18-587(-)
MKSSGNCTRSTPHRAASWRTSATFVRTESGFSSAAADTAAAILSSIGGWYTAARIVVSAIGVVDSSFSRLVVVAKASDDRVRVVCVDRKTNSGAKEKALVPAKECSRCGSEDTSAIAKHMRRNTRPDDPGPGRSNSNDNMRFFCDCLDDWCLWERGNGILFKDSISSYASFVVPKREMDSESDEKGDQK